MSRDLESNDYYKSSGGLVPVKWTAPEVRDCASSMVINVMLTLLIYCTCARHLPTGSILLQVTFGVLGACCLKCGALETSPFTILNWRM